MPKIHYTLTINGEIEVDNAVHMLDYEGQMRLISEDVLFNRNVDMREVNDIEFEIVDD